MLFNAFIWILAQLLVISYTLPAGTATAYEANGYVPAAVVLHHVVTLHLKQFVPVSPGDVRVLSLDIDGTIADVREREHYAVTVSGDREQKNRFFNVFLNGKYYEMDTPVAAALRFVNSYKEHYGDNCLIVYLSGRRYKTEHQTQAWLAKHGFPAGIIFHRHHGNSMVFKEQFLKAMKQSFKQVDAHIGDRVTDDGGAAASAGVKFLHCTHEDSTWPHFDEVMFA